jgi:hypothetical protein
VWGHLSASTQKDVRGIAHDSLSLSLSLSLQSAFFVILSSFVLLLTLSFLHRKAELAGSSFWAELDSNAIAQPQYIKGRETRKLNRTRREAVTGAPEVNVLNLCNCVFNRI